MLSMITMNKTKNMIIKYKRIQITFEKDLKTKRLTKSQSECYRHEKYNKISFVLKIILNPVLSIIILQLIQWFNTKVNIISHFISILHFIYQSFSLKLTIVNFDNKIEIEKRYVGTKFVFIFNSWSFVNVIFNRYYFLYLWSFYAALCSIF